MKFKYVLEGWIATTLCVLAASCASEDYRYVPATHRANLITGAIYDEPPDAPTGSVRVQFAGIGDVQMVKDGPKTKSLHLKLVASNHAASGFWNLNASDFFVSFPDGSITRLLVGTPSSIQVPPGGLLAMDIYFPLPEKMSSEKEIAEFDFHWKGTAIDRPIGETTAFDRIQLPTYYATADPYWDGFYGYSPYGPTYSAGLGYGWGRAW